MSALAIFSLAGILAGANVPTAPSWESNYANARKLAETQKKPIAVFVAAGETGWQSLTREGGLSDDARKTLADHYLCVFANTDTSAGKKVAAAFGVTDTGLIISDRTGQTQAFKHTGQLTQAELASRLVKYADPAHVVTTTETAAPPAAARVYTPVNYAPAFPGGGCPNCRRGS